MNDDPRIADLIETFSFLDDWEDRYRYVIDLGRDLEPLADSERVDASKVRGCASQVWLVCSVDTDTGVITFRGQSDAAIVQGLLSVLLAVASGRTGAEVLAIDIEGILERLGFLEALTPQRSNGLKSMVARIRAIAEDQAAAA